MCVHVHVYSEHTSISPTCTCMYYNYYYVEPTLIMIDSDVIDELDVIVFVIDHEEYARLALVVDVERLAEVVLLLDAQLGALLRRAVERLLTRNRRQALAGHSLVELTECANLCM